MILILILNLHVLSINYTVCEGWVPAGYAWLPFEVWTQTEESMKHCRLKFLSFLDPWGKPSFYAHLMRRSLTKFSSGKDFLLQNWQKTIRNSAKIFVPNEFNLVRVKLSPLKRITKRTSLLVRANLTLNQLVYTNFLCFISTVSLKTKSFMQQEMARGHLFCLNVCFLLKTCLHPEWPALLTPV